MGYSVCKCDEFGKLILADGGAFLAHKRTKHNSQGYGKSKIVAIILDKEKKHEFRDIPQEKREEWIKTNGVLKLLKENNHVYVI